MILKTRMVSLSVVEGLKGYDLISTERNFIIPNEVGVFNKHSFKYTENRIPTTEGNQCLKTFFKTNFSNTQICEVFARVENIFRLPNSSAIVPIFVVSTTIRVPQCGRNL